VQRITISVEDSQLEAIHRQLDYGDNRSEWIRDAIQGKLDGEQQDTSQSPSEARETAERQVALPDTIPDRIDTQDAREAIEAAVSFIESNNGATMREIVTGVGSNHNLGYELPADIPEGERYRGAWYRKIIRPGLKAHPDIQKPDPGQSEWRHTG
jgi:Arc/MetJ-type ribon-helix-helix transcriptional regulator